MKFELEAKLTFEADSPDEAYLKMGIYMLSQMEQHPLVQLSDLDKLPEPGVTVDVLRVWRDALPDVTRDNSNGYAHIMAKDVFEAPPRYQ